jgi:UDP-glucose 4-epimerase
MVILITGNAGLLGSRLADYILENTSHNVIGIDDLSGGYIENVHQNTIFINKNLTDDLDGIFEKYRPDVVYHFAAYAAEGLSPFIRVHNYKNNLIASANLINNSIKYDVSRFVFASSMAVYGNIYEAPFDESMLPSPIDPYGVAKYSVEQDLKIAFEQHKLPYTTIRPHNFYGVNQNIWDTYRNVLGIWMYQLLNGEKPTIFGDGLQRRAFSYVDDSIIPLWNASQRDDCVNETINLGGIEQYTILNACESLIDVTGMDIDPIFMEKRHEVKNAFSTWDKSVKLLNFEHKTDLKEGLNKMWEWAKLQPVRERFHWSEYEITKGLYDYWK